MTKYGMELRKSPHLLSAETDLDRHDQLRRHGQIPTRIPSDTRLDQEHNEQVLTDPDLIVHLIIPHIARQSSAAPALSFHSHWWSRPCVICTPQIHSVHRAHGVTRVASLTNIGSGALGVQCKVATMAQLDNSVVPKWNEKPSTLDAFEERVILHSLGKKKEERYLCGPRLLAQMDPERQPYKMVKSAVTTTQLAAEGGATLVIAALRRALGTRPIQEAVRLFRQLVGLRDMRRQPGESMRKWTLCFEAFIKKTGKALHQADAEIDETTFLHPLIQGILLLECSNLSPAENAAVLATRWSNDKGWRLHWKQLSVC